MVYFNSNSNCIKEILFNRGVKQTKFEVTNALIVEKGQHHHFNQTFPYKIKIFLLADKVRIQPFHQPTCKSSIYQ